MNEEVFGKIIDLIRIHGATNIVWKITQWGFELPYLRLGYYYNTSNEAYKNLVQMQWGYAECNGGWAQSKSLKEGLIDSTLAREINRASNYLKNYYGWERDFWQPELEEEFQGLDYDAE